MNTDVCLMCKLFLRNETFCYCKKMKVPVKYLIETDQAVIPDGNTKNLGIHFEIYNNLSLKDLYILDCPYCLEQIVLENGEENE